MYILLLSTNTNYPEILFPRFLFTLLIRSDFISIKNIKSKVISCCTINNNNKGMTPNLATGKQKVRNKNLRNSGSVIVSLFCRDLQTNKIHVNSYFYIK